MKTHIKNHRRSIPFTCIISNLKFKLCALVLMLMIASPLLQAKQPEKEPENYIKGVVTDKKTGDPLPFASITIPNTNISVVSNTEGAFQVKIPENNHEENISVSYIGYKVKLVSISSIMHNQKSKIELESANVQLPELNVRSKDATGLVKAMFENKEKNYGTQPVYMTAFYRESIKKNRSYASLAEAVIEINKQGYNNSRSDVIKLYKSRKKTDYSKVDTLVFKLMGGPFNTLNVDVVKHPNILLSEDIFKDYEFSYDKSTYIDKHLIYIVDFKQTKNSTDPMYYGKMYIDSKNFALKSIVFSLNMTNKEEAANLYIMKKPMNAKITPIEAKYRIDYEEQHGVWHLSYSRIELAMKINWKRKLFSSTYYSTLEMAITDHGSSAENISNEYSSRIKSNIIISDEASGFADNAFWGEFNVIEPEKPIEAAIRKIQKNIDK